VRYEPSRIDISHVIVLRHLGHNAVALRASDEVYMIAKHTRRSRKEPMRHALGAARNRHVREFVAVRSCPPMRLNVVVQFICENRVGQIET
jgi:hypothetical protein